MSNKQNKNVITRVEAYLASEKNPDAAIKMLKSDSSPESVRRQIMILLGHKRIEDALKIVESNKLDKIWCDQAVLTYVLHGDKSKAQDVIDWARQKTDMKTWRKCLLEYSENIQMKYFQKYPGKSIILGQVTPEEQIILEEVINTLLPIVNHVKANKRIVNKLELRAISQSVKCNYVIGNIKETEHLATLLESYTPIPLDFIQLALSRLVQPKTDIARRVYSEHKDNFEASLLALVVECELSNQPAEAFKHAKDLKAKAHTEDEKREYCNALFNISQLAGIKALKECYLIVKKLLGEKNILTTAVDASIRLRQGKIKSAKSILEGNRDENNAQWLQLYSYCLFSEENFKDGLEYFSKATTKMPAIEMYKVMGDVAIKGGYLDKAIIAFESILRVKPEDEETLASLAQLYLKVNDFESAERHLNKLWKIDKKNDSYGFNYAECLKKRGKIDEAMKVYGVICSRSDVPVEAVISVAQLYKAKQEPTKGFDFMTKHKDAFWDEPQFLMAYMDLGYSSENESEAHEAFIRVRELQSQGKASPDIIQPKSIDDLLEYGKRWDERKSEICRNVAQGKLPWLLADNLLRHAAYTGWGIRTQPLTWLNDNIEEKAAYGVYSTNGFHSKLENGRKQLLPLAEPVANSEIFIDLSTLITLHRLEMLEIAKDYFAKIYVSTRYVSYLLDDVEKLCFHQLSYVKSTNLIKQEIDSGKIIVLADAGEPNNRPYPYLHEYTMPEKEEEHYYRIADITKVLFENGEIDKDKKLDLSRVSEKGFGADKKHPELTSGQSIIVELSTLRTLINQGIYESLQKIFKLHVTSAEKTSIDSEMFTIEYQEKLQQWNNDLIEILKSDVFESLAPNYPKEDVQDISLDGYYIAKSKGLDLYADDRAIQALALNRDDFRGDVFGTDCFIKALEKDDSIDYSSTAAAYSKLFKWRYRFIVPSDTYLVCLAKKYQDNPPGQSLRAFAAYLHDCMRDPGLFSGFEDTEPPMPMAGKLFTTYINITRNFILGLWKDDTLELETVKKFTRWAISELLPSPPKTLIPGGIRIASATSDLVLGKLIFDFAVWGNRKTSEIAINEIKSALDLSDDKFLKMFTNAIDIIGEDNA